MPDPFYTYRHYPVPKRQRINTLGLDDPSKLLCFTRTAYFIISPREQCTVIILATVYGVHYLRWTFIESTFNIETDNLFKRIQVHVARRGSTINLKICSHCIQHIILYD